MKRLFSLLLCISILLGLVRFEVFAGDPGDGNIDGGGGGMGEGTLTDSWSGGNDGVRITIVDAETGAAMSMSVDYANRDQPESLLYFGFYNKIHYRTGTALELQTENKYRSKKPDNAMPIVVSSGGRSNIEAIKRYFCSEYACKMVADAAGFDYNDLVSGDYKLLLEPIAYFLFNSQQYCMTATEAALYDQLAGGALRSKLPSLCHQNLPLAMFLEYDDLGFAAWGGPSTGRQSNADIINYLGLGIVRFKEKDPEIELEIEAPDVEYRTDTDVITSITLHSDYDLTPDDCASVTFSINGVTHTVDYIYIPAYDSQVVWVKWHTPPTPQDVTIYVSVSGAYTAKDSLVARISELSEIIPPDPLATDTSPGFSVPPLPANPQKTSAYWGIWRCSWVEDWHYVSSGYFDEEDNVVDASYWEDRGWWGYEYDAYSASLSGSQSLMPDDAVPTAAGKNMKSGYGVKHEVSTILSTDAPDSHYTYTQTAFSIFPEFKYEQYLRILERVSGGMNAKFQFKPNAFSTYDRHVHFTPVWFPDGSRYTVYTQVWDTWTPGGMLSVNLSDYVTIQGSLFDDWHTSRD